MMMTMWLWCVHQDVVGVVTPSEDRDPNEMCQVCNALESTSVATSAALLQEGYPCDDGDLCTYNDQCTTEGLCVATPYPAQTCMIGSEWGDDPSLDCEVSNTPMAAAASYVLLTAAPKCAKPRAGVRWNRSGQPNPWLPAS